MDEAFNPGRVSHAAHYVSLLSVIVIEKDRTHHFEILLLSYFILASKLASTKPFRQVFNSKSGSKKRICRQFQCLRLSLSYTLVITWAKFSTLDVDKCMLFFYVVMKQNCLTESSKLGPNNFRVNSCSMSYFPIYPTLLETLDILYWLVFKYNYPYALYSL